MKVLHIDQTNKDNVHKIDEMVKNGHDVFILVYMVGCGPCNATRPEWKKIEGTLEDQYADNDKLVVIDIDKDLISDVKSIGNIDGFPTMKYINNNGDNVENYEDSNIKKKDRTIDSFINWIESKILKNKVYSAGYRYSPQSLYDRITETNISKPTRKTKITRRKKRNLRGGKWSRKYKRSINCRKPRGFSQKQYCKYGRK
jgi:hypothetical protein